MGNDKQIQKAGDNSKQYQAQIVNVNNNGITEQRAREIYSEMNEIARRDYTQEAYEIACKRVGRLEELLMLKLDKVDGLLEAFADPSFQFLLQSSQKTAACSDREADYEMLTELLVHRVEKKDDRKTKASIAKAVEIVDQIDDDALCALTLIYAINSWTAVSGNMTQGLSVMNDLFSSLCYIELPQGMDWAYHLDVLDAARVSSLGTFKKFNQYYPNCFNGYTCVGIKKDTENYQKAIDMLNKSNLPLSLLIEHELNNEYVRLNVNNRERIEDVKIYVSKPKNVLEVRNVTVQEIDVLNKVWDLYSNDANLKKIINDAFMQKWDTYDALKKVRLWWDNLPHSITISPIGRVLAHANAQRYSKAVPEMND